jgi:hypothetical protein
MRPISPRLGLGYFSAHLFDCRETSGQLGTSPSEANSGCAVANESDDAAIAAAIVTTRVNLLMAKRIDDPHPMGSICHKSFSTSLGLDA